MDRIPGPGDFSGRSFRARMALGFGAQPKEVGRGKGQRHRALGGAGFVGIVAWIQFCYRRSAILGTPRTFG